MTIIISKGTHSDNSSHTSTASVNCSQRVSDESAAKERERVREEEMERERGRDSESEKKTDSDSLQRMNKNI